MKLLFYPLLLLLAFVPMMAQAGNTFDPATNTLSMDHVRTTDGDSYTDLEVKVFDYEVISAKVAVEVPPDFHDGNGGTIGVLPDGHTCFLGVTPGCKPNDNWQGLTPDLYAEPGPDHEPVPGPGTPCGFGPPRPGCN